MASSLSEMAAATTPRPCLRDAYVDGRVGIVQGAAEVEAGDDEDDEGNL